MTYLFDTSSFISWWNEIYPKQSFPDIYELIEQDVKEKIIQSPMEVRRELEVKVDDDLTNWEKNQNNLFINDDEKLQEKIAEITNDFPKLIKHDRKFNADPIIVALAESNGWTVVTEENQNKNIKTNLVACCRYFKVECISLSKYIRENNSKLNSIRKKIRW